ncbi:MAG: DHA2 family efflux MFS transporter permease subunit [Proteobacteria bacterium]|nr:MAG: DHA2 family efflux MFS transporter permease subunit [Pseudomonadota bacterium]
MEQTLIRGPKVGITIAAMAAALMAILDISIVNVALTDIRASFGTPIDQIAWVSTGYMMANVVVIPLTGWFQRRFGFKKYFTFSIILFIIASALCGMAWNLPSLVAFRILQGMGGGAIIPTSQSILFARYPQKEHGMAGALFGLGAVTGPLLGPTIGGYLIDIASWHWIFLINVPVGIFAAAMAWKYIEEPEFEASRAPVDRWGLGLLAVGMGALQYVLEEGNREDWFASNLILGLACTAVFALVVFVYHQLETEHPIVDLRVFKDTAYSAATGINFLVGMALFGAAFLFSLYCGSVMHYKAIDIGMLFLKGCWIQVLIMPFIGKFAGKFDGRLMIGFGMMVLVGSLWMHTQFTALYDMGSLIAPLFVRSVGLAFIFVPLSILALSSLPARQRGNGAGLFNLTRELGGSIGTAWMSSMLNRSQARATSYYSEHVTAFSPETQARLANIKRTNGWRFFDSDLAALATVKNTISQQALVKAFNNCFWYVTIVFALGLIFIFFLKKPDKGGAPIHDAH